MTNWREYKLSELMQIKYGKDHKHLADGPYPLYGSGGIMRYVEKPLYNDVSILIPRKGTLNNLFYLNEPFWSVDTMFYSIINKKLAIPKYLYYALKTFNLASLNVGSAVPSLTTEVLNDVLVSIPDIYTQTAIAEILSSLDDKIELNNKINQELENLAQTLFKRWFIDFEFPVNCLDQDFQDEQMNRITASQSSKSSNPVNQGLDNIPTYRSSGGEMVESELGEIPKGWEVTTFRENIEVFRGLSYKGSGLSSPDEGVPMINLNSVHEGGGYKYEGIKFYSGEYKERHTIRSWDLAVTNTEQGHKYLLIGYPAFVPTSIGEKAIFSHHIYRVKPLISCYLSSQFFFYLIKFPSIREQIIGACNGTTVNMLKIAGLETPKFIKPDKICHDSFSKIISGIWQIFENNYIENQSLTQLRDTLLPKLISGELAVKSLNLDTLDFPDKKDFLK